MTVLELVVGGTPDNPPRTPTATLDLAGYNIGERIYLHTDGFSPSVRTKRTMTKTIGRNGQRLIEVEADNATIELYTYLSGGGYTELEYARREIAKYVQQAEDYESNGIGSPVWIRHRWTPVALKDKADPQVGQWSRYWRVLGADMEWPRDLHAGQLASGNVERLLTRLVCAPVAMGHRELAYNTAGLPGVDSDISLSKAVSLSTTTGDWCIAGWFKHLAASYCVFELYYTANYYFNARYNAANTRWEIRYKAGGSVVLMYSGAYTYTAGTWLHVAMSTNGNLYINGVLTTTMGVYGWQLGTFYLGDRLSGSDTGYAGNVDGWRIWEENWTQAEIQALYADELPVKTAGLDIGRPLYNKSRDGSGALDNCDGTISGAARDNWTVIGAVPGDLPTPLRIIINPPNAGPTSAWGYYLGLETSAAGLTPTNQHWSEYSGTTDTGTSSGDAYKQDASIGSDWILFKDVNTQAYAELLRGRYTVLLRMRSVTTDVTLQPFIQFYDSDSRMLFAEKMVPDGSVMNLVEVGDLVIPDYESLPRVVWGAYVQYPGSSYTLYTDFVAILKNAVKLTLTTSANVTSATSDKLVVDNGAAELQKSTGQKFRDISYVGPVLEVVPGLYNYLFGLFGKDAAQHYPQLGSTVTVYVTPRWTTSGGPVAG